MVPRCVGWVTGLLSACALAAAPTMTNLSPATRPSARTGTSLVAAVGADGGELGVLFGGNALLSTNNQTWTYAPTNWSQRAPTTAPSARAWHTMTWDAQQQRVILFGGSAGLNGPLRSDTWAFDPLTDTWVQLTNLGTPPSARFLTAMVYVPELQRHLLFGGGTATSNNAEATALDNGLWWLDVNVLAATATWTPIMPTGTAPPARASACCGYDSVRRRLIVFGGEIVNDTLADTAEYDVAGNAWVPIAAVTPPTKRGSAVCTFDARANKFVLYGGVTTPSGTPQSAAFEYAPATSTWKTITPAPSAGALTFAGSTYSARAGGMMLFGGRTSAIGTSQATWTMRLNATPRLSLPTALTFDEGVLAVLPATVSDADPDVPAWSWTQDGGASVPLSGTTVAQPTFTTPSVTSPQQFRFSVSVSDGIESASGFVDVTVRDNVDEPPLVDAGPDQAVDAGTVVQLSGAATDPNAESMTLAWVQRSGPVVTLSRSDVAAPTFVAPAAGGVLVFDLTATDTRSGVGVDSVSIDVAPDPTAPDAGSAVPDDGGSRADAGTGGTDAGGIELDAGTPDADAGAPEPDSGPPQRRKLSVGCGGCGSTGAAPLLVALAALWRRRRFRARA